MKQFSIILFFFLFFSLNVKGEDTYVSFPMMNQEIKHSLQEHERQKEMKKKESQNLSLEKANEKKWSKLKVTVKKIQSRLSTVDFALQGIPTGVVMSRKIKEINKTQKIILKEITSLPPNLITAFKREITFVKDFEMVARLMFGLIASYGVINQMERAERKILLDYALDEVDKIRKHSSHTLYLIREAKFQALMAKYKFNYYVNRDKEIVASIMSNIKNF